MVDNLSTEQLAAFKQTFESYDDNNSRSLDINELIEKMKPLGGNESTAANQKSELSDLLFQIQGINTEEIRYPDFISIMASVIKDEGIERELELAYLEILNKKGSAKNLILDKNTMRRLFMNLGEQVTDEELTRIMETLGSTSPNLDHLKFDEFQNCMRK